MFVLKRSQIVIFIISTNLLLNVFATVISKTSLSHVSPARKLNPLPNNNAYVISRSNSATNLQNNQNLANQNLANQLSSLNVRTSRTNLTSDNSRLNEEIQSPQQESVSSNFTKEDVQTTLNNDKTLELNVSNSEVKPFEDINNVVNKNNANGASQNDNFPITQVDTFNNKDNNLEYSSSLDNFNHIACLTCPGSFRSDRKDSFSAACCSLGYNECCSISNQNNVPATNNNVPSNNVPINNNLLNSNIAPNIISTNSNVATSNDNVQSSNSATSIPASAPLSVPNNNNKNNSPNQPEHYGTKSKIKSPANKIKNVEPVDENIDIRQQQHQTNNNYPIPGIVPGQINGVYNSNGDKIYYTNSINQHQLAQFLTNLQRNNMQYSSNILNNLYSNSANSNTNNNQYANQFQGFIRKTSLPNKPGTKSNSNSISDSSFNQAITDQQTLTKQPNENLQPISNSIQLTNPVIVDSINPSANSINTIQQANVQNNMQRQNNRNPNEINQQHTTQQQTGIFSSFISHIPFIGYRPVVFGSPSQQQNPTQQQINNAQMAQIVSANPENQYSNQFNNNPYSTVIAINPQTQNAQLLNQNQMNANQLQAKIASQQNTNSQAVQSPSLVSTMFSRPLNLYNRIGGYFQRPSILTNSANGKPVLHYANQVIPLDVIPEILNEPQMQNILQQYSQPINLNNNYDGTGQYNGAMYIQLMKDSPAKSSKRS